jgi:hypothetical protein
MSHRSTQIPPPQIPRLARNSDIRTWQSFVLYLPAACHFSSGIKSKNSKSSSVSRPRIDVPKEVFEPLSPYNWDFRTIPDWLLRDAIKDEYLRSWPEFRAAALKWLQTEIDGRPIRDHLMDAASKNQWFPKIIWDALPQEWNSAFLVLQEDCAYPVPLTWMLEKGIIQELKGRKPLEPTVIEVPGYPGKSLKLDTEQIHKELSCRRLVDIHPLNKHRVEFVSKMLSFPDVEDSYGYHLLISFDGKRNEELVKAFAFWLKEEAKKKRMLKVHGRASAPHWHRLKQLAAKRLSDAGLNYKAAWKVIEDREKAVPTPRNDNVFPKYNSAGAWHDAVNAANLFVETMKKNFHFEDWELL